MKHLVVAAALVAVSVPAIAYESVIAPSDLVACRHIDVLRQGMEIVRSVGVKEADYWWLAHIPGDCVYIKKGDIVFIVGIVAPDVIKAHRDNDVTDYFTARH
jgi:chloramphenicol 3-O-phosphotransferase